jgi:hypothetical protein
MSYTGGSDHRVHRSHDEEGSARDDGKKSPLNAEPWRHSEPELPHGAVRRMPVRCPPRHVRAVAVAISQPEHVNGHEILFGPRRARRWQERRSGAAFEKEGA